MGDSIETNRFMIGDPIAWLDWSEIKEHGFRNEVEREFLTAFFIHAPEWSEFGVTNDDCMINYLDSRLMIGFDILDSTKSKIERVIKIEFTGESILMCEFNSSILIFCSKLDPNNSDVIEYRKNGSSTKDLANKASEWVLNKFSKKSIVDSLTE